MRRNLWLGLVLALFLLPAPLLRAQDEGDKRYTMPFEFDGLIFIEASINGVDGLRFMLDTGASQNVITETGAKKAGVEGSFRMPVGGVGQSTAKIAYVDSIAFGGFEAKDVMMAQMDMGHVNSRLEKPMDGIIGAPLLFKFKSIDVDFDKSEITFVADAETFKKEFNLQDMIMRGLSGRGRGGQNGQGGGPGGGLQDLFKNLFGGGGDGNKGGPGQRLRDLLGGGQPDGPTVEKDKPKTTTAPPEETVKPGANNDMEGFFDRMFGKDNTPAEQPSRTERPTRAASRGGYQAVDNQLSRHLGIEGGVFVNKMDGGSRLADAGVQEGDVILKISGRKVKTPDDIARYLKRAGKGDEVRILREGIPMRKRLK